jgi:hypothetical protein
MGMTCGNAPTVLKPRVFDSNHLDALGNDAAFKLASGQLYGIYVCSRPCLAWRMHRVCPGDLAELRTRRPLDQCDLRCRLASSRARLCRRTPAADRTFSSLSRATAVRLGLPDLRNCVSRTARSSGGPPDAACQKGRRHRHGSIQMRSMNSAIEALLASVCSAPGNISTNGVIAKKPIEAPVTLV